MTNPILSHALQYAEAGYSVIPVSTDKKPFIKWTPYQKNPATLEEVTEWFTKWPDALIGIVTGKISNLFVVDCDSQEAIKEIEALLPESFVCPIAETPRNGRHYYFSYPEGSTLTVGTRIIPGVDYRGQGGYIIAPPSVNGSGKAYQWLPGLSIFEVARPPVFNNIINYIIEHVKDLPRGKNEVTRNHEESRKSRSFYAEGSRDQSLFSVADALQQCKRDPALIEQTLDILANNCNPPFPKDEVRIKIDSALKRSERRERNIASDLREWVGVTEGHFRVTDYHAESRVVTREDKHAVIVCLKRLQDEGIIEKYGTERGVYRRIEREYETSDWLNASTNEFDITLPFDLNKHVKVYPGNIIIFAGTANVGKTSVLLNILRDNMQRHPVHYVSSEAGAVEMKSRIMLFDDPKPKDWKFEFIERSSNFADLIRCHTSTKRIWIIDYLEMPENPWQIVQPIREIHSNLKDGVCILALQKKSGSDVGRGGEGTLEKPRLYISLDRDSESNIAKIVKAKAWRSSTFNPNGRTLRFKLINGAKIKTSGAWA